jgi:hypothetical protein
MVAGVLLGMGNATAAMARLVAWQCASVSRSRASVTSHHDGQLVAVSHALAGWVLLELCVRVRESVHGRGRTGHDRFTRVLIATTIGGAIALAINVSQARSLQIADPARAAGLAVTWVGLAIRIWAIVTLGQAFRTTVGHLDRPYARECRISRQAQLSCLAMR